MKKLFTKSFLALSAITLFTVSNTNAQTIKNLDLAITTFTSPTNNQEVAFGENFDVSFNIKNNGPAAIAATDTIYYIRQGDQNGTVYMAQGLTIASGATSLVNVGQFTNQNNTQQDQNGSICFILVPQSAIFRMPQGGGDTVFATVTYNDTDTSNDKGCVNVTLKKAVSILDANNTISALDIYPNPATDIINFKITLDQPQEVVANILDATGRLVMTKNFGKINGGQEEHLQINLDKLSAGLYFVDLRAGDYKAKGKVTIK
jgi:hypothetical protein